MHQWIVTSIKVHSDPSSHLFYSFFFCMYWSWQWKQESLFNSNNYKGKQNVRLRSFPMTFQQAIWWWCKEQKEINILGSFLVLFFFQGLKNGSGRCFGSKSLLSPLLNKSTSYIQIPAGFNMKSVCCSWTYSWHEDVHLQNSATTILSAEYKNEIYSIERPKVLPLLDESDQEINTSRRLMLILLWLAIIRESCRTDCAVSASLFL